jgi:hypothetical protein
LVPVGVGVTADTVYWIAMKLLVWLTPVCLLILMVEQENFVNFLGLSPFRRGISLGACLLCRACYLAGSSTKPVLSMRRWRFNIFNNFYQFALKSA